MNIWDISNINNPQVPDCASIRGYLRYLSHVVKRGRALSITEHARSKATMPYRIYAKSSKSSRGKK